MSTLKTQKIIQELTDLHTHFGDFTDSHYSSEEILAIYASIGIKRIATMLVPMKEDGYIPNNHSLLKFLNQDQIEVILILLTSPLMVQEDPHFKNVADIPYRLVKIHPRAHQWHEYPLLVKKILDHASENKLPVMIHTGEGDSQPVKFISWFKSCPDVRFILAHGRPVEQVTKLMHSYKNVWVEISFMTPSDILALYSNSRSKDYIDSRILFGTDLPIVEHFTKVNNVQYLHNRINELLEVFTDNQLLMWGKYNVEQLLP